MIRTRLGLAVVVVGTALPAVADAREVPVYDIEASAATDARRVSAKLGLGTRGGAAGFVFHSADRFRPAGLRGAVGPSPAAGEDGRPVRQRTPVDLAQMRAIKQPPAKTTVNRFAAILKDLGLRGAGTKLVTTAGTIRVTRPDGTTESTTKLDRRISMRTSLGGIPLVGPGAKVAASFGPDGKVRQAVYALPRLARGRTVELLTPRAADAKLREQVAGCAPGAIRLTGAARRLVYRAPQHPGAKTIHPYYEYSPTFDVEGQRMSGMTVAVPAGADSPVAQATAAAVGPTVRARVGVKGGRAPYQVSWTSCSAPLDPAAAARPALEYQVPATADGAPYAERLLVEVTDADGRPARTAVTVQVDPDTAPLAPPAAPTRARAATAGVLDYGIQWMGPTQGLWNAQKSVNGFMQEANIAQAVRRFNFGEYLARREHFLDRNLIAGGLDHLYADNADMAILYTHGYPDGWSNWGGSNGFQLLTHWALHRPRYGDDLEWLILSTCETLKYTNAGGLTVDQRWRASFQGLHGMLGYATKAYDEPSTLRRFARYLFGTSGYTARYIIEAWAWASFETQPDDVRFAIVFPVSKSTGRDNLDDTWKTTTPDMPYGDIERLVHWEEA